MNTDEAKIFAAEINPNLPLLDLHGLFPDDAENKLDNFLYQCFQKRIPGVRIIYGIGTGKLKDHVLDFLAKHSLVSQVKDEGAGAVVILAL